MTLDRVRDTLRKPDAQLVIQTWIGTRILVFIAAAYVAVNRPDRNWETMFTGWDVAHFLDIARNGYTADNSEAFFPGLPMLLRLASTVGINDVVAGVLLSMIGSILATIALYRLGGPAAAIAWLLAPTTVFTVVGYTESLFCAAAFWAWDRAKNTQYWQMALLAGAAASIRVSGLFLIGALGILLLTQAGSRIWICIARMTWLLIPLAVMGAYMVYLHAITGDWMAWYHAQSTGWPRELTNPLQAIANTLSAASNEAFPANPEWKWIFRFELVSVVVGVVTTVWCVRKKQWAEASYVAVQIFAFSVSYWFQSVCRAVLLWFPTWIMVGQWAQHTPTTERGRKAHMVAVGAAVTLGCVALTGWAWLYFSGLWAS